jgi:MFS family permease
MLTAFDKLWLLALIVVTLFCGIVGACLPIVYLIPSSELPAAGRNFSLAQTTLCLGGMALGYALALGLFGFLSRRFLSAATHQRWADYLGGADYARRRFPLPFGLLRWVLVPTEVRELPSDMRSNNRWRGP